MPFSSRVLRRKNYLKVLLIQEHVMKMNRIFLTEAGPQGKMVILRNARIYSVGKVTWREMGKEERHLEILK